MNSETISINLNITLADVNGILTGLAQLPYGQVAGLIQNIQGQAEAQVKAQQVPSEVIEAEA